MRKFLNFFLPDFFSLFLGLFSVVLSANLYSAAVFANTNQMRSSQKDPHCQSKVESSSLLSLLNVNTDEFLPPVLESLSETSGKKRNNQSIWHETGLYFDYLHKKLINDLKCHQDEESFVACATALGSVAQYSEKEMRMLRWVPISLYKEHPDLFGKPEDEADLGVLVEVKPHLEKTIEETVRYFNQIDKSIRNAFIKQFHALEQQQSTIDFNQLFEETKKKRVLPHPEFEEDLTASTWVAFLHAKFDPHTRIIPKKSFEKLKTISKGLANSGIGVGMHSTGFGIFLNPNPYSPAELAGVHSGDRLIAIDYRPLIYEPVFEIENVLSGPVHQPVVLTLSRAGKVFNLIVDRKEIDRAKFSSNIIQDEDTQYGYLKLGFFPAGEDHAGCKAVRSALLEFPMEKMTGVILDLRGNPGGGMDEATCIASLFLGPDHVISQVKNPENGNLIQMTTTAQKITKAPLVVIVDGGSASSAEILSGALQEHGRGVIIGDQTFGKGNFQSVTQLQDFDQLRLIHTEGLYYLASGRSPQLVGITPDIKVLSHPKIDHEPIRELREEDSGTNPIPTKEAFFVSPQRENIEKMSHCVHDQGRAEKRYFQMTQKDKKVDYPLIYAQEVLDCSKKLGIKF